MKAMLLKTERGLRGATPAEVAEAVYGIAASGFMTGEAVNLNGGAFMSA